MAHTRDLPKLVSNLLFPLFLGLVLISSVLSCAAGPRGSDREGGGPGFETKGEKSAEARREAAGGVRFRADSASLPAVPSGVGAVASDLLRSPGDTDADGFSAQFRDAYAEAAFRGIGLGGTLGGDYVHGWPQGAPRAYAQNWRRLASFPNSWGLPSLALAVRPLDRDRVFLVQGAFLDLYGKGEGVASANGVAGYGAPLSDEFPYEGGAAQRFERGLMTMDFEGTTRFLEEPAPSASSVPGAEVGASAEPPPGGLSSQTVAVAFRSAWTAAVDRGLPPAAADGPILAIALPPRPVASPPDAADFPEATSADPFALESEDEASLPAPKGAAVESVLIQTYGAWTWALALPVGTGIGRRPLLLEGPFLDLMLVENSWQDALGIYGVPLSDPFPGGDKIAQRFSAGWMEMDGR